MANGKVVCGQQAKSAPLEICVTAKLHQTKLDRMGCGTESDERGPDGLCEWTVLYLTMERNRPQEVQSWEGPRWMATCGRSNHINSNSKYEP